MLDALAGTRSSDVPCGTCCTSSQFVHRSRRDRHVGAHPAGTPVSRSWSAVRTRADGLRRTGGLPHVDRGEMLDLRCSPPDLPNLRVPRLSRCRDRRRTLSANAVARHARRWRFAFPTSADEARHAAVLAAVRILREPGRPVPGWHRTGQYHPAGMRTSQTPPLDLNARKPHLCPFGMSRPPSLVKLA